jgi:hypothetical protein
MVSHNVLRWNSLGEDLIKLYARLVGLGMEYLDSQVYLPDLE